MIFHLNSRQKLDSKNVSLENVIIKENESLVVGTVKVKNTNFQKEILVRSTWDNWKTQQDTFCVYSPVNEVNFRWENEHFIDNACVLISSSAFCFCSQVGGSGGCYVLYDTFSFKLTLPPASNKIEFCVCFRSDGKECWDNNNVSLVWIYLFLFLFAVKLFIQHIFYLKLQIKN